MSSEPVIPSADPPPGAMPSHLPGYVTGTGRAPEDWPDIRWASPEAPVMLFPLAAGKVSAGFPSPAADYEEERFNPMRQFMRNPVSTFFFTVKGDSMIGAEIFSGDTLAVDRSIQARHGHIVVAFINGERLVKRLYSKDGRIALLAENPAYPPLEITEETDLLIWGVVVGLIKSIPA